MLRFPYQDEPLSGPAPPSLAPGATVRWRPLVPVTVIGPAGRVRDFGRAVVDPAADDTVFPSTPPGASGRASARTPATASAGGASCTPCARATWNSS
jgi:hypothetical protein